MKMYLVGGMVRDEILGLKSKDADFSVTLDDEDMRLSVASPFQTMVARLKQMGFEIFLETPEHLTVRAQFPDRHVSVPGPFGSHSAVLRTKKGLTADFVLARKDGDYSDGRRPDTVEVGTLHDDLARRDFTMNAIAKDERGNFIDPFNGVQDINDRVVRAVGSAYARLMEDALRAVRALRFSVTKGFRIDRELQLAMTNSQVLDALVDNISDERIKDELSKMLRYDSVTSIFAMQRYPDLTAAMLSGSVSLDATMKTKGRGR